MFQWKNDDLLANICKHLNSMMMMMYLFSETYSFLVFHPPSSLNIFTSINQNFSLSLFGQSRIDWQNSGQGKQIIQNKSMLTHCQSVQNLNIFKRNFYSLLGCLEKKTKKAESRIFCLADIPYSLMFSETKNAIWKFIGG